MADEPQTWEVALDVDGSHRVERVTIMPPFGIRRADAEVKAIRRVEGETGARRVRALQSRFVGHGFCCRRCVECPDQEHHWLHGEVDFDEETGEPIDGAEYGCKHCEAVGAACTMCGADPVFDDVAPDPECPTCKATGIVVVGARR